MSASYPVTEPLALGFGQPIITHVSCFGYSDATAEVTAFGGVLNYSFTWNGTPGPNPLSNLTSGVYDVIVTDANNCTASTSLTVNQPVPFTVTLDPLDATCNGALNGTIEATPSGGTPNYNYQWSNGTANQNATGLPAGSYTLTITDANTCTVSASATIGEPDLVTFNLFPTQVKCPGDRNGTIEVRNTAGGTPPYNFSATQDGSNFVFATDGIIVGLASGTYAVIVADANGCTLVDTTFVPSPVPDTFEYEADSTSCYGQQYTDGAVHIRGLTLQNMPYQFGVDDGPQSFSGDLYNLSAGTHVVNATNFWGCPSNITVFVPEPGEGRAEVFPEDTTLQLGQSIQLSSSFGPYPSSVITSYIWSPAEGLSCIDCRNPLLITYSRANQYTLTVIYNNNCSATATLNVQVQDTLKVFVPNSFSPNGDGNNDEWMIFGEGIKAVDVKIFNRWGEVVYKTTNQFAGWDGTFKGELQNPAVFVFHAKVTFLDDRETERLGSIMLVR
jgi:gliding motility-associated-like protein